MVKGKDKYISCIGDLDSSFDVDNTLPFKYSCMVVADGSANQGCYALFTSPSGLNDDDNK